MCVFLGRSRSRSHFILYFVMLVDINIKINNRTRNVYLHYFLCSIILNIIINIRQGLFKEQIRLYLTQHLNILIYVSSCDINYFLWNIAGQTSWIWLQKYFISLPLEVIRQFRLSYEQKWPENGNTSSSFLF